MTGSCEHGNELSGWEILQKLSEGWLLKKDAVPLS
jgi:hypothetical protein